MNGSLWQVVVIGVGVALLPGILNYSSDDAGLTGEFAGVIGALSSVIPLMFLVAAMVTFVGLTFFSDGGAW